jgi:hypothetical protein
MKKTIFSSNWGVTFGGGSFISLNPRVVEFYG